MAFFPFEQINQISPRPLLLIAGTEADTLYFSQNAYQAAKEPKELYLIEGAPTSASTTSPNMSLPR